MQKSCEENDSCQFYVVFFPGPRKGHRTVSMCFLSRYHKLLSCYHSILCHSINLISHGNGILSCDNEVQTGGNKILSGYHKILKLCFHSYPY